MVKTQVRQIKGSPSFRVFSSRGRPEVKEKISHTVCPRSLDPMYIVTYYIQNDQDVLERQNIIFLSELYGS